MSNRLRKLASYRFGPAGAVSAAQPVKSRSAASSSEHTFRFMAYPAFAISSIKSPIPMVTEETRSASAALPSLTAMPETSARVLPVTYAQKLAAWVCQSAPMEL